MGLSMLWMYVFVLTQIVDSVHRLQELMDIYLTEGRGPMGTFHS